MNSDLTTSVRPILEARADFYQKIRHFFKKRGVLEVQTPILELEPNPSPGLEPVISGRYFLPSSPEFAMKRLLAAGSGDIFQITKAFRGGETGRWHRVEFAILEWYRLGFSLEDLLSELLELLAALGFKREVQNRKVFSYLELFKKHLNLDPLFSPLNKLQEVASHFKVSARPDLDDRASWAELLFTILIEPKLAKGMVIVKDFPPELAMLAALKVDPVTKNKFAQRFELYLNGIELANAFKELTDATEQYKRFNMDLALRKQLNLTAVPLPNKFLAALKHLAPCAGIAVGLDRLLALKLKLNGLEGVLPIDETYD